MRMRGTSRRRTAVWTTYHSMAVINCIRGYKLDPKHAVAVATHSSKFLSWVRQLLLLLLLLPATLLHIMRKPTKCCQRRMNNDCLFSKFNTFSSESKTFSITQIRWGFFPDAEDDKLHVIFIWIAEMTSLKFSKIHLEKLQTDLICFQPLRK